MALYKYVLIDWLKSDVFCAEAKPAVRAAKPAVFAAVKRSTDDDARLVGTGDALVGRLAWRRGSPGSLFTTAQQGSSQKSGEDARRRLSPSGTPAERTSAFGGRQLASQRQRQSQRHQFHAVDNEHKKERQEEEEEEIVFLYWENVD